MKIHGAITPVMADLFQENPELTTPEAVAALRDYLATHPDGAHYLDEAADMGLGDLWGKFIGTLRGKAQKILRAATVIAGPDEVTITIFENMKLPLPEGDFSPTYADCTAIMLRRSITYMKKQIGGLEEQIALATKLADQLDLAIEVANDPTLTVRDAFANKLIAWEVAA